MSDFDNLKKTWAPVAQAALWASGMVVLFVADLPRLWIGADPPATLKFIQFVLAVLTGSLFVFFRTRTGASDARFWVFAALGSLAAGVALYGLHMYLLGYWTSEYDGHGPVVIGSLLTDDAKIYLREHPDINNQTLIQDYAGQTDRIWLRDQLINRFLGITGCFSLLVVTLSLAVLFVIQALRCGAEVAPSGGPVHQ